MLPSPRGRPLLARAQRRSAFAALLLLALPAADASPDDAGADDTPPVQMERFDITERRWTPTIIPGPDVRLPALARKIPLELFYPGSAYSDGVSEGFATIGVQLDEEGRPLDFLVVSYTRPYFARALLQRARKLAFQPLQVKGVAVPSRYQLTYRFVADAPVMLTVSQAIENRMRLSLDPVLEYHAFRETDLDRKLEFKTSVVPSLPAGYPAKPGDDVSVIVSFYVDETGRVRLPNVDFTPAPELVPRAIEAVAGWSFEPPIRQGKPVLVGAGRELSFTVAATP